MITSLKRRYRGLKFRKEKTFPKDPAAQEHPNDEYERHNPNSDQCAARTDQAIAAGGEADQASRVAGKDHGSNSLSIREGPAEGGRSGSFSLSS